MKSNLFLKVVIIWISFWSFVPGAMGQADERLAAVMKLSQQGKPKEALAAGQKYLKELRESLPEADHPAIGMAASVVGMAASAAGEHEEAVRLLKEGIPIIRKMRAGQLFADELPMSEALLVSLEAMKRTDEAMAVLEDLQERARKQLAQRTNSGGLKLQQPGGPAVALDTILVNEDALATLLERSGMLQLKLKRWEQAERDLKEVEQILKRIHPDEQQARLVKLREGWEEAARKQGKAIRPHLVGRFSMPRTIQIQGNTEIPTEQIHTALTRSSAYVMASHPGAEFDAYLQKLQRCLELGYLANGFPNATVTVDWDGTKNAVSARIVEGPRFKAGGIRIQGAKALTVEKLLESLKLEPDAVEKPVSRAEETYKKIIAKKGLQGEQKGKGIMEAFPENLVKPADGNKDEPPSFSDLMTDSSTSAKGVWEKGKWADYQPSFLDSAKRVLYAVYATEGLFFPKFKLKLVPEATPGVVELSIEVTEEGPSLRLGKLHVAGNRTNTREELMTYLGLEEGMELKGDYMGRVKRSLYESGRFLGWEVISRRTPKNPDKIDLLIEVAEEWQAPSLSQSLTREQEVMLKFAKWVNTEAGEECDLVFSASGETKLGPVKLSLAMGSEGISFSADGLGHHLCAMAEKSKEVEFVTRTDQGSTFRALFPMASSPLAVLFELLKTPAADPFSPTGSVAVGLGLSTESFNLLRFAVDPAAAISTGDGEMPIRFENGEMIMEGEGIKVRIDERNGRLISLEGGGNGWVLAGKAEAGGVARIRGETRKISQRAENWAHDKSPYAFLYLAMGYLSELVQDEGLKKNGLITGISLDAAAARSKRWEPLAVFLGDVTTPIGEALGSILGKMNAPGSDEFLIPLDGDEMSAKMQAGSTMTLLLGMGAYDLLAEYIEPGSWQDLVSREILFYLDGKPFYQNQSVETLLADDTMGPLGSLLCARLLKQVGNPAAARFVTKARAALKPEGFAKDWTPVLRGTAKEDNIGSMILKAIRKLDDKKIDGFLPAGPPAMRSTVKDLVAAARTMEPATNAEIFRPVLESLWESTLKSIVEGMVNDMEESITPKMDPAIVAATVNGKPVFRGAMRLMQKLEGRMLVRQTFPIPHMASMIEKVRSNGRGNSALGDCVSTLLLAQGMWNKGQSAMPEFVDQWSEKIAKELGEDGWDQIAQLGLTRDQYKWWVGTMIAAQAYGQELAKKPITEKETRDFYEAHKQLGAVGEAEIRLYTIRLNPADDGSDQKELAESIRKKVDQAGPMEEKIKVFMDQAKQYSGESDTKPGGERGWVHLSDEFSPAVAAEIAKVPEQSLSGVIPIDLGGQRYFYLALIPEKKRPGMAKSFEQVASYLTPLALLDRELSVMKKRADVHLFDEPTGKEPGNGLAKSNTQKAAEKGIADLLAGFMSAKETDGEKDRPKQNESHQKEKKEKLSLELVTRKAAEGSARHIYLLGTYSERGLVPESGTKEAIQHYEKAAALGERSAMSRLSEIYRTGRGVDKDDKKAQAWKEKAFE